MNNIAFSLAQALQTASWYAKQWQTFFFVQDDFRVTPGPDAEPRPALRAVRRAARLLRRHRPGEPRRPRARPPPEKDTNNWAPRVGFNWSPAVPNAILGDGKTVFRGGFGMGYDVLFYNLLTVNGSNYPRVAVASMFNVVDVYPSLLPAAGAPVFNPLASYVNSAEDTREPGLEVLELLDRPRARRVRGRGRLHRQPAAATASTRSTPTRPS